MRKRDQRAYNSAQYKAFKQYLRTHEVKCWVSDDKGPCHRRGTIPDHSPPLALYADPALWDGELLPMCAYHSNRQRGMMAHGRMLPAPSRVW